MHSYRLHTLIFLLICLFSHNALSGDAPALNKALIDRFFTTGEQIEMLESTYPSISTDGKLTQLITDNGKPLVQHLAKTAAYDDIEKIIKTNGFSSVEEFAALASRLFSAIFAVAKEQNPAISNAISEQNLEKMKQQMRSAGMPEAMVKQQMQKIDETVAMQKQLGKAANQAKPEDINFVQENWDYIQANTNK